MSSLTCGSSRRSDLRDSCSDVAAIRGGRWEAQWDSGRGPVGGARPDYTIEVCGEEDFLWAGAGLMNDFRVCHCVTVTSRLHISPFVTRVCLWRADARDVASRVQAQSLSSRASDRSRGRVLRVRACIGRGDHEQREDEDGSLQEFRGWQVLLRSQLPLCPRLCRPAKQLVLPYCCRPPSLRGGTAELWAAERRTQPSSSVQLQRAAGRSSTCVRLQRTAGGRSRASSGSGCLRLQRSSRGRLRRSARERAAAR